MIMSDTVEVFYLSSSRTNFLGPRFNISLPKVLDITNGDYFIHVDFLDVVLNTKFRKDHSRFWNHTTRGLYFVLCLDIAEDCYVNSLRLPSIALRHLTGNGWSQKPKPPTVPLRNLKTGSLNFELKLFNVENQEEHDLGADIVENYIQSVVMQLTITKKDL